MIPLLEWLNVNLLPFFIIVCMLYYTLDPVNDTYEDTNNMYNTVVAHLMGLVHQRGSNTINMIIATHNTESVNKAIRR